MSKIPDFVLDKYLAKNKINNYSYETVSLMDLDSGDFDLKAGNVVFNCSTEEIAKAFMDICKSKGYKWCNGKPYSREGTKWDNYKSHTCYNTFNGTYGNIEFYKSIPKCKIIHVKGV